MSEVLKQPITKNGPDDLLSKGMFPTSFNVEITMFYLHQSIIVIERAAAEEV
jgi:hypothetical protein